jgi:hypothetical protein
VDEPHTTKGYRFDFDLLIIVSQKELADRAAYWTRADERLIEEMIAGRLRTPVNFIVHSLQQVNDGLAHGRFFMDIAREGIAIYESDDRELARPCPGHRRPISIWRESILRSGFRCHAEIQTRQRCQGSGFLKETAFSSIRRQKASSMRPSRKHLYTPHNHNIAFLRTQAERLDLRLVEAWPRESRKDRALFEKLKDAYVKGRYSKHYRITTEELVWLSERVGRTRSDCACNLHERISALEAMLGLGTTSAD